VLARYVAGESTPDEVEVVRVWLARDAQRADLVVALERTIGRLTYTAPPDLDVEGALRRAAARRDAPPVRDLPFAPWLRIALPAAAAVALLLGGGVLWRFISGSPATGAAHAYRTPAGRSDSLVLRDGTRVLGTVRATAMWSCVAKPCSTCVTTTAGRSMYGPARPP
jgi:ferric-dicitrate binding protein FerR (iron transport regulator)